MLFDLAVTMISGSFKFSCTVKHSFIRTRYDFEGFLSFFFKYSTCYVLRPSLLFMTLKKKGFFTESYWTSSVNTARAKTGNRPHNSAPNKRPVNENGQIEFCFVTLFLIYNTRNEASCFIILFHLCNNKSHTQVAFTGFWWSCVIVHLNNQKQMCWCCFFLYY